METCPKCGFSLPENAADCPRCGIILEKFRPPGQGAPTAAEPPLPPPAAPESTGVYAGPSSSPAGASGSVYGPVATAITEPTLRSLNSLRPWVSFQAGYLLVVAVLMLVAAVAVMVLDTGQRRLGIAALVYLVDAGILLALAFPLKRSGKALEGMSEANAPLAIEEFVDAQASFWRRAGWLTLITLAIVILAMLTVLGLGIRIS